MGEQPRADSLLDAPWLDEGDQDEDLERWAAAAGVGHSVVLQEVAEQTSYGEIFLNDLIRRQRRLSLRLAAVFLALLVGLPLVNLAMPAIMGLTIVGLPLSWLMLAVLTYPLLWLLAVYFTIAARTIEDEFMDLVR
jgi:uncharacterized membrane protein (DUF485 family)